MTGLALIAAATPRFGVGDRLLARLIVTGMTLFLSLALATVLATAIRPATGSLLLAALLAAPFTAITLLRTLTAPPAVAMILTTASIRATLPPTIMPLTGI